MKIDLCFLVVNQGAERLTTPGKTGKGFRRILALAFLLVSLLATVHARGSGSEIRSLLIFDSSDRIIATIKVRVSNKRIEDVTGTFDVILVQPNESGLKIRQKASKGPAHEKVVVLALPDNGRWRPAFAWGDYRLFSRPAVPNLNPLWSSLLVSTSNRSTRLSLSDVESSASPTADDLWGYRAPSESFSPSGTEFVLIRRPLWQSLYARSYFLSVNPGIDFVEFVCSNPPTTFKSFPDQLPPIVPHGQTAVGHVVRIPVQEGKAKLHFIPSEPMPVGDALTVYIRNILKKGICPNPCTAADAQLCPLECPPVLLDCMAGNPKPFIAVCLMSDSPERPAAAMLKVWVGGIDHFTIPYASAKYYLDFSNGLTVSGTLTDPKRPAYLPWPADVPLNPSFITANGKLIDVNGREEDLQVVTYKTVDADQAFNGSVGHYAERDSSFCHPLQRVLATAGASFVLKRDALLR